MLFNREKKIFFPNSYSSISREFSFLTCSNWSWFILLIKLLALDFFIVNPDPLNFTSNVFSNNIWFSVWCSVSPKKWNWARFRFADSSILLCIVSKVDDEFTLSHCKPLWSANILVCLLFAKFPAQFMKNSNVIAVGFFLFSPWFCISLNGHLSTCPCIGWKSPHFLASVAQLESDLVITFHSLMYLWNKEN